MSCIRILVLVATSQLSPVCVFAGKGGNRRDDSKIINPDKEGPPKTLEFNKDTEKFTEGDMIVQELNKEDRNAVSWKSSLWIAGVVPYVFDESFSSSMQRKFEAAITDFNANTCIRFVTRLGERDYVNVTARDSGCYANLGKRGGVQPLNLQEGGWFTAGCGGKGTVIHEMLHTIGFAHEQSRNDRDTYITVNYENIDPGYHSQFRKMSRYQENNQGFPYDFSSVMHYPDWGFAVSGKSITTKDPSKQSVIGQRYGFSKQDIEEVNELYDCDDKIKQPPHCRDTMHPGSCRRWIQDYGTTICQKDHYKSMYEGCQNTCRHCRP